jgi:hypothetical protein
VTPAQVAAGLLDTFDKAVYVTGFLAIVAMLGGVLHMRWSKKWRQLENDLKQSRWRSLYR